MTEWTEEAERSLQRQALAILERAEGWIGGQAMVRLLNLSDTRELRSRVIYPLRFKRRIPVHFRPGSGGGYKLRVTAGEHAACLAHAGQMGRDFMAIRSVLQDETLDVAAAQMVMDFLPAMVRQTPAEAKPDALAQLVEAQARAGRKVRWVDVLTRLLEVMAERPEEYAEDIDRIGDRFSGLFLPPEKRRELLAHLDAARGLVGR